VRTSPPLYSQPRRTENEVDRSIRLQLGKLFAQEPDLGGGGITFDVENGNVTLKGEVDSEAQRRKARDIAMDIPGVRSVANAVRVHSDN